MEIRIVQLNFIDTLVAFSIVQLCHAISEIWKQTHETFQSFIDVIELCVTFCMTECLKNLCNQFKI